MRIIHTIAELRAALAGAPKPVLVPTMGNLHEGHLSLVRIALGRRLPVVVTIFVNRLQFAPTDDFDTYPRTLSQDCALLKKEGCELVFAPPESEMYPQPQGYEVQPPNALAGILEGRSRPGFFIGVCTVVLKLFNIVSPEFAVFGKKDYQQLLVIKQMVKQLALPIEVIGGETVRDPSGLAMSSRNAYLNSAEREEAAQLSGVLRRVVEHIRSGRTDWREIEHEATEVLMRRGWLPDYVAIRRRSNLGEPDQNGPLIVLAAARLGTTRLLDNIELA
jgi:pantoate--beta-alanine ligase